MKGAASIGLIFQIDPMVVLRSDPFDSLLYSAMARAAATMMKAAREAAPDPTDEP